MVCVCACIHMCMCVCVCACTNMCVHTFVHVHMQALSMPAPQLGASSWLGDSGTTGLYVVTSPGIAALRRDLRRVPLLPQVEQLDSL